MNVACIALNNHEVRFTLMIVTVSTNVSDRQASIIAAEHKSLRRIASYKATTRWPTETTTDNYVNLTSGVPRRVEGASRPGCISKGAARRGNC